jgi:hypothetical protein
MLPEEGYGLKRKWIRGVTDFPKNSLFSMTASTFLQPILLWDALDDSTRTSWDYPDLQFEGWFLYPYLHWDGVDELPSFR